MAQKKIYELTSHSSIVSTDVFPISDDNSGNGEKQSISGLTTYLASNITGIPATAISDGSISNTEFGYLNGISSNIQTQIDSKANTTHTHTTSDITNLSSYTGFDARYYTETETDTLLNAKQATLVSGTNIKTVNGNSLLGSGDIVITGGGSVDSVTGTLVDNTDPANPVINTPDADDIDDTSTTNKFVTQGEKDKLANITVTQAVDLDQIESDTTTNNAKVTNATHTGEMTGSGALTADPTLVSNKTLKSILAGTEEVLINDAGTLKKTTAQDIADLGGGGGGGTRGSITGTLSAQTDLQTALDGKVDENTAITGATKTKITYDSKGLVTSGADATTADIADSANKRYVTDAQQTVIGNTSGTNTGDQTSIVGITGTKAQFDTAVTDGNFLYVGDVTQYTDEMAQDAVGGMVDSTLEYVDATPLLKRAALTGAITASSGSNTTALGSFTKAQLNTAISDGDVMYLDSADTVTGVKTFATSTIKQNNPAGTFAYTIVPSAIGAARNLTLPLITADDTLAVLGLAQTYTQASTYTAAGPQLILGVNTTTLGSIKMFGNTSGDATIRPTAAAGTATVVTLPNASSTLPIYPQQITYTGPTAARTITLPDANFTVARTDAANTFTGVQTMTSPSFTTPVLGTPSSGNLSSCTADGTNAVGFLTVPQNSQSAAYTAVLADSGKSIDHPSTDANARTFTIPANGSVAYPVGTCLSFSNMTSQVVTIAITSDTMYLAGAGTTGSRSLAQYGTATARKLTSTTWLISGIGLT